jgi:hypothetical protein
MGYSKKLIKKRDHAKIKIDVKIIEHKNKDKLRF